MKKELERLNEIYKEYIENCSKKITVQKEKVDPLDKHSKYFYRFVVRIKDEIICVIADDKSQVKEKIQELENKIKEKVESKMRINLIINGAEQIRIENGKYYISVEPIEDWFVMEQVDKSIFRKELEKYKWCENSWDKELSDKYKRIKEEVK